MRVRWQRLLTGIFLGLIPFPAGAQPASPRIGYVYPAGGQQGTTFVVTVGGQHLADVASATLSGQGIRLTVPEQVERITQKEYSRLRTELAILQQQEPKGREVTEKIAALRKKLSTFIRRPATPAIAETVQLQVHMSPCRTRLS